ncbi:chain length determinant protein [Paucilactobacillus oligofermentans DSM 15707 = LMG 22743]|uniref:Capsular polysaccharide biosynthesis protein CpsC n=1 Tax=Paucilactobacillus oligofermentans DSM 15707 = LMG 22743 TaxID=1423778 RepID=A0A0R1RXU0_9LACO|nr:Wzz/FepE/Etk N-terminal domain-containing protein [Paucilactobacillus oligofermentans]KRL58056.1 chain length determinant protein [Paucilactobacillus oligofermentans DSM 15707 = LMG 22743]CUS26963.1 Putative capsular polysaccharide biosynthesis CapA [Paucilactobacillus oligofermentans DSM 15707 = LMG 22743]
MDNMLDIRRLFSIFRKHLTLIILSMVGCAVVAFGVAEFVVTPQYTSTTQILVNQKTSESNAATAYATQQADVQMISTYKDIITNQVVLTAVKNDLKNPTVVVTPAQKAKYRTDAYGDKELVSAAKPAVTKNSGQGYDISVAELQDAISVSNQQNSQVFALAVKTDDPAKSAAVANAVAKEFKNKIKDIMEVNNVTIVSKAVANNHKTSPKTIMFIAAGVITGFILSVGYALLVELTNTSVRDDEFLQELGLANLGQVNRINMDSKIRRANNATNTHDNDSFGHRSRARV